jgi:peptidoglycan/xylan/chitin deacetylase (PgdA/CDA1 family)
MRPYKRWLGSFSTLLSPGLLSRTSGIRTLLPYHHVVSDQYLSHIKGLYNYKDTRRFTEDLDWLLSHYQPLHPDELANSFLENRPLPPKTFLLSFDDGFREVHDVIAPILLRKGVPALFFINPAFIDNKELFYRCKLSLLLEKAAEPAVFDALSKYFSLNKPSVPLLRKAVLAIQYPNRLRADELGSLADIDFDDFLQSQQPFLTTEQVQNLSNQGFIFGGHSIDHPAYRYIDQEEQFRQTIDSVNFAHSFNPSSHRFFAFPHEDVPVSQAFFDWVKAEEQPIFLFGLQNGRREDANRLWHRFNAEDPTQGLPAQAGTVQLYNSLLRLAGHRAIHRK